MGISDNAIVNNAAEVARIENRLKEIGGYKFLPPSIKEEKERLAARLIELKALAHQMENESKTSLPEAEGQRLKAEGSDIVEGEKPKAEGGSAVENPKPQIENQGLGLAVPVNPFAGAPAQLNTLPDSEEKVEKRDDETPATGWNGAYGTIGQWDTPDNIDINREYEGEDQKSNIKEPVLSLPKDQKDGSDEEKEDVPDKLTELAEKPKDQEFGAGLNSNSTTEEKRSETKHEHNSTKRNKIIDEANDLVRSFKRALEEAGDNIDVDYLRDVVREFERLVKHLEDRAAKVEMPAEQKTRAIKGRLESYTKEIKAEFEFSDLLPAGLEKKIKELIQ
ncbi:MAG: hypothetical protein AAB360_01545 [Patescibacteria group bacterium]